MANSTIFKAAVVHIAREIVPATHLSNNKAYLERIFDEPPGEKMFLKTLNGYGGGGGLTQPKYLLNKSEDIARHNPVVDCLIRSIK
ncbi:hypothetical protein PALB_2330 [Pseudoalteromonas luteoviolacea B = ATCC 29581]|nr:hypothetical protein PALB_2330 [Pseudoalteromonas luteoviolacea B = ATCC 29581]